MAEALRVILVDDHIVEPAVSGLIGYRRAIRTLARA